MKKTIVCDYHLAYVNTIIVLFSHAISASVANVSLRRLRQFYLVSPVARRCDILMFSVTNTSKCFK